MRLLDMPLTLFRLVHVDHDPVQVGQKLSRSSDKSNQKLGKGMYFALSRQDALGFAGTRNYAYTHLVEVTVPYAVSDFFDQRKDENAVAKWVSTHPNPDIPPNFEKVHGRSTRFCEAHNCVGFIWEPKGSKRWVEVMILEQCIGAGFEIMGVEPL